MDDSSCCVFRSSIFAARIHPSAAARPPQLTPARPPHCKTTRYLRRRARRVHHLPLITIDQQLRPRTRIAPSSASEPSDARGAPFLCRAPRFALKRARGPACRRRGLTGTHRAPDRAHRSRAEADGIGRMGGGMSKRSRSLALSPPPPLFYRPVLQHGGPSTAAARPVAPEYAPAGVAGPIGLVGQRFAEARRGRGPAHKDSAAPLEPSVCLTRGWRARASLPWLAVNARRWRVRHDRWRPS